MNKRHGIRKWLDADLDDSKKPCRVLLWLTKASESWRLREVWIHPYLRYEAVVADGCNLPADLPPIAKVHRFPPQTCSKRLLLEIEMNDAHPLDFIISPVGDSALVTAASSASIPLVIAP
jgi:hypothetical protein